MTVDDLSLDSPPRKAPMSLWAKLALGCGAMVALGILVVVGLFGLVRYKQAKWNGLVVPFVETYLPELTSWDPMRVRQYWAPEVLEAVEPEQEARLFRTFARLGALVSHDPPAFRMLTTHTAIPYPEVATYQMPARFENGDATLTFRFVWTEADELKLWHVHIDSEIFLAGFEGDFEEAFEDGDGDDEEAGEAPESLP